MVLDLKQLILVAVGVVLLLVLAIVSITPVRKPASRTERRLHDGTAAAGAARADDEDPLPEGLRSTRDPQGEAAAAVFDFSHRLAEVRELYAAKRYRYCIGQTLSLLSHYDIEPRLRMELYFLLAACYREEGEMENAEIYMKKFRDLLDEVANQYASAKSESTAEVVRTMVVRARERAERDNPLLRSSDPEDRPLNERCWERLLKAGEEEVLQEDLPEGGTIYYSRSGPALERALQGMLGDPSRVAIGRDPQYRFYFQVLEK